MCCSQAVRQRKCMLYGFRKGSAKEISNIIDYFSISKWLKLFKDLFLHDAQGMSVSTFAFVVFHAASNHRRGEPVTRQIHIHYTRPLTTACLPLSYIMLCFIFSKVGRNCISFLVDLGEQFSLQPYDSTQIKYFSSIPIDIETPHDELTLVMKSGEKSHNTTE